MAIRAMIAKIGLGARKVVNLPGRIAFRGKTARIAVAIAAALVVGSSIGGAAMLLAGTEAHSELPIYYGELERLPTAELGTVAEEKTTELGGEVEAEDDSISTETARLFGLDEDGPLPPALSGQATGAPPASIDPKSLETGTNGNLPIIDGDGRRPLDIYARPSEASDRAKIAIVVVDLGLDSKLAADSVQLPPEVSLGFSPYMAHGGDWHGFARSNGHETLLSLPVVHPPSARRDEGPLALDPRWSEADLQAGLNRVLVRGEGYVALAARSGSFAATPEAFTPVATALAERGIGLVELGEPNVSTTTGLAKSAAEVALDRALTPIDIENQLRLLEQIAEANGQAIGYTRPYPLVFDRIWHWANNLDNTRFQLVPVSSLLRTVSH